MRLRTTANHRGAFQISTKELSPGRAYSQRLVLAM